MRRYALISTALLAGLALAPRSPAWAQSATPRQIQAQIAQGQEQAALSELQTALQAHPDSGVAWYLTAEAQDRSGNESAAQTALNNAEHYAPGLPFARPADVASLQSHISGDGTVAPAAPARSGVGSLFVGIVGVVVLFLLLRMFFRRRRFAPGGYPAGYGPTGPGQYPQQYPYGQAPGGFGSGLGGSILGGLAAGAGFAAGERIIGDAFGQSNDQGGNFQQDPGNLPDRDDGLQGNPGWDDNSGQGGFDPGNNW